jgi:hypothetical protein
VLIGPGWLPNVALLAVSVLIVVRGPWSLPAAAAVVLSAAALDLASPQTLTTIYLTAIYMLVLVTYRTAVLFVLVWLVAAFRAARCDPPRAP